ncbi:hypothetical protein BC826DRAFT_651389 [Russula brevipes]|nr:hypothetical protein BC826DRAFT_651389 [Russula brevipes]
MDRVLHPRVRPCNNRVYLVVRLDQWSLGCKTLLRRSPQGLKECSAMGSRSRRRARKRGRHRVSAVTSGVVSAVTYGVSRHFRFRGRRHPITIDILPDDVLLEIFNVYTNENSRGWHTLVHVSRRWRSIVFASTHRLNLQLRCTPTTPVKEMSGIWPPLPIIVEGSRGRVSRAKGADNIVAALGHPDRVRRIDLWDTPESDSKRLAAAMKEPFPELTHLNLGTTEANTVPVLPDSFLGGSAPRLQTLRLFGIPFPAVPKLLSSASGLVELRLWGIPHSGYIVPEAMVTGLSALTRLKRLSIGFLSPRSRPGQPSPPRLIRTVLPTLEYFVFRGVSEYLEDLTSRIVAPLLRKLDITFFNQLIFNTPRLWSFIGRAEKLRSRNEAQMVFTRNYIKLYLMTAGRMGVELTILCRVSDWQLSSLTQICSSPFLFPSNLERLDIREPLYPRPHWQEDVENTQWLELLHPFANVKALSLCGKFTPRIVPALRELSGERIMDVLPRLHSISLLGSSPSGPVKAALTQFLTARRLSGHPVAVNTQH